MKSSKRSAGVASKSGSHEEPYFVYGNTQMTYEKSKLKEIFRKNGEEIKRIEVSLSSGTVDITSSSSKYTMNDFQKDIKEEVANFLRPSFDQIVLLIGAGGSIVPRKAVPGYGKTDDDPCPDYGQPMTKILEYIKEQLPDVSTDELLSLDDIEEKSFRSKSAVPKNDLEALLSQFEKAEEFVGSDPESAYKKTLDKIKWIIREKTRYNFQEQYMKHLVLINFFNRRVADGNKLSIVTTNYDTVLEEAAAYGNYIVFDGFTFGDNPTFDAKMFDWNLVKDVPNLETKELIYNRHTINLLKIHGSLTWNKEDGKVRKVPKETNKSPLLIFPSNNKYEQSYLAPYSDFFYKFRELLNRPRTLLVTVGFSFGDTHIFEMVNDAIRHNDGLSMLFTDYSIDSTNSQNLAALQKRSKEGYRIAFLKASLNDDLPGYLELKENDK